MDRFSYLASSAPYRADGKPSLAINAGKLRRMEEDERYLRSLERADRARKADAKRKAGQ